jgi:acyl-coenzyme A synthetase/AMP-(fatty) acid ligase
MSEWRQTRPSRDAAPRLTDYEQERSSFRLEPPARYNPVLAIVESWARDDPDAPAVLTLDALGEPISLQSAAQLAAASRRAARALLAAGIGHGDRVFVMLPRIPEWYAALLGAMRIGAVPMPGPNLLTPHDIADRLTRAHARAAITDEPGAAKVEAAGVPLDARF